MRASHSRRRVAPGGWRALRREAHTFKRRSDALAAVLLLVIAVVLALCIGVGALASNLAGRLPPALQVIDDIRFNADYRRGSTFTAAALAKNGLLFMGTDANGIFSYRTESGWQGIWQQFTKANTNGGLVADNVVGLGVNSNQLLVAASGGLSSAKLDGTNWQSLISTSGFAPLGSTAPDRVRLSPSGRWLAVATPKQGIGLYDTLGHDWLALTAENKLLPADTVTVMEFDPGGNLWVGTSAGLLNYQIGAQIRRGVAALELHDESVVDVSFGANRIAALAADGKVFSLAATFDQTQGQWQNVAAWKMVVGSNGFTADARLPQDLALAALTDKAVWVVTNKGAVGRYDLPTHDWQTFPPVSPSIHQIWDFLVSNESAFIATDAGLFDLSGNTLVKAPVRKLASQGGQIWYLTDGSQVGYFDSAAPIKAASAGTPAPSSTAIAPAANVTIVRAGSRYGPNSGPVSLSDVAHFAAFPDELWMAVPGSGVGAYNLKTHEWRSLSTGLPIGIAPASLVAINGNPGALVTQDNTTALYGFGSDTWTQISAPDQDVKGIAPSADGLWYQTAEGALFFTGGGSPQGAYFGGAGPQAASTTSIPNIPAASASSNALWIAQDGGKTLYHYDVGLHQWSSFPQNTPISHVAAVDNPDQSAVVLSGGQAALLGSDGAQRAVLFGAPPTLPNGQKAPDQIVSATEYQTSIFFTTPEGQLYRYDQLTHTLLNVTPPNAIIQAVAATAGSVWAMGNGDLFRFSGSTWEAVVGLSGEPNRMLPLGNALAILTVNNSLDWVDDKGNVAAQSVSGFAGLQDLTAIARAADGRVWFGSATHGLGLYSQDQHSWTTDETAGHIRALVAVPDAVLYANDQGIYSFLPNSKDQVTEIEGDIRGLVDYGDRAWALIADKDGIGLYRRDGPSRWTAVRNPNSAPADVTTITAVAHVGNRFVFGTSQGQVFDYNVASGQWRLVKQAMPISRVDWIGLNGDLSNDGRNSTIWALGPQDNSDNMGRLVEIDTTANATIKSPPTQNIVAATIGAGRIWYTDDHGAVSFLSEGQSQPTSLAGLLPTVAAPTNTQIPTATFTATTIPSATPTLQSTGPATAVTLTPTSTATLTKTPTLTPTVTLTPTLTIPQHLGLEPVKTLAMSGQTLWLATANAIYQTQWNGTQITAQNRTEIAKTVTRLKADDTGLLIAFSDGSAAHIANGKLDAVQGYDSTVLYSDAAWLWRLNGDHATAYFMGNELPFTNGQPGFDQFQAIASDGKTLWLGGAGGAEQIDTSGLPVLYTPPPKGLPGTVQGIRYDGVSWLASLSTSSGTAYRRFDPASSSWSEATSAEYAKPVTALTIGPVKWQITDQGVVPDPPSTVARSRFPADVFTAIATDGKQLYAQTPVGFWVTATPGAFGTFTEDSTPFVQYFSGTVQTTLPAQGSPWNWTVSEDRATGQQTTKITLSNAPAIVRQFDKTTGAFTDDEVLAIANDGSTYTVTANPKAATPTPTATANGKPTQAASSPLWIATKGGLWHASISSDGLSQLALFAVGQPVSGLRNTSAGLLVYVDGAKAWQLLKGGAFTSAPADAAAAPLTILKSDILGTLLEQAADGTFTLHNMVNAAHPGFWFDQVGAFAAFNNQLWISTGRGLIAYSSTNGRLLASRFDSLDQFHTPDISALATGPLDPRQPDSPSALWALSGDVSRSSTWTFQNGKWIPAALERSPFVSGINHPIALPGDLQFSRDGATVTPILQGRAISWSNGRFDFDDIRDLTADGDRIWTATAGGPSLLNGEAPCPVQPPNNGLPSNDLKRVGMSAGQILVRDGQNRAFTLDCSQQPPIWKQADKPARDAAFGKPQVLFNDSAWTIGSTPETAKAAPPLAVTGLSGDQLFTDKRFSFDTVRDTTINNDSLWLATAGGPLQFAAGAPDGASSLALQGLSQPDTMAIRSEPSLRIGQQGQTFRLDGQAWATDTDSHIPVTDARLATFDGSTWQAGPLPASSGPSPVLIAVKDAPPTYTVFVPSGKFSFDDVRDVTVTDSKSSDPATPGVVWLATTGGVVQGQAIGSIFHSSQLVAGDLCGIPDAIRVQDDKVFVGYNNRANGQFIGDSCTDLALWQRDRKIVMPGSDTPLTLAMVDGGLAGKRGSTVVFTMTQTGRTAWLFGTVMSLNKAKLINVIDDGGQTWLIFDNNLVVLHKDVVQRVAGQ